MRRMVLIGVLLLAWTVPASAEPTGKDLQIFHDVARQVKRYHAFTIFDDVQAHVDAGVVTLTGTVTMPYKRNDLGRLVERVDGVRDVKNAIRVLPVSPFDDELRYRIARAIYGNPAFWNYAAMVNPPIHIVVEHGRVTLTGVVTSDVERMLARSLAAGNGAFDVRSLLRTEQEMKDAIE